jgi:hypothetical protein
MIDEIKTLIELEITRLKRVKRHINENRLADALRDANATKEDLDYVIEDLTTLLTDV